MNMSQRRQSTLRNQARRGGGADQVKSLTDTAYAILKRRIIRCEMPPGLHITESQLVSEINIGKTPVREALARLAQEGLVRSYPRYGYVVAPITLGDVKELFGLRLIVEPAAVELAAGRVDVAQLRQLDHLCAVADLSRGNHESLDEHLHANRELHAIIARASGNQRLAELIEKLHDESERMLHLSLLFRPRREEILHEHRALIDALAAGDAASARQHMIEQIRAAEANVLDALLSSPSVLSAQVALPKLTVTAPPSPNGPPGRSS
jgi:DNA-binding GntR family transcriptional regulator